MNQSRKRVGPEELRIRANRAAPLDRCQAFAEGVEFPDGGVEGAITQLATVSEESNPRAKYGEGPIRSAREGAPRRRRRVATRHPEAEERGMLVSEAAKDEPGLNEVGPRIVRTRQDGDGLPQQVEGLRPESGDEPLLGAEETVDGPRRRSHFGRHAPHRQRP